MRLSSIVGIVLLFCSLIVLSLVIISPYLELGIDMAVMFFMAFVILFIGGISKISER
jgi:hypothetical protein